MLLQSHEGYIEPLAALPDTWNKGNFKGLMARGNFQISANWENGHATCLSILSNKGEICRLKYAGLSKAKITDNQGNNVKFKSINNHTIEFKTQKGKIYQIKL